MTRRIGISYLIVIGLMSIVCHGVDAQAKMSKERLDSIQLAVVIFFKEKQCFKANDSAEKCLKTIYFYGLGPSKYLGDDQVGIYHTGVLISNFRRRFLLIVDSNGWQIENGDPVKEIEDLASYFKRHHTSKNDIDWYLNKLLAIHEYNK